MDYTKGPWKVIHEFNVISDTGRIIAACGGHSDNHNVEGTYNANIANTRLIAAAPDMYEALKDLLRHYRNYMNNSDQALINRCLDALRKAEGRTDRG